MSESKKLESVYGEMNAWDRLRQMLMEDAKHPQASGARTALVLLDNIELTEKAHKELVDQLLHMCSAKVVDSDAYARGYRNGEETMRERAAEHVLKHGCVMPRDGSSCMQMTAAGVRALKLNVSTGAPKAAAAPKTAAIPMILTCPGVVYIHGVLTTCGARHIDEGEFASRSHKTHTCQECGFQWQPALVPTVGVKFLPGCENAEIKFLCSVCNASLPSTVDDSCRPCLVHPQAPPKRWEKSESFAAAAARARPVHRASTKFVNGKYEPAPLCGSRDNGTPLLGFERDVTCKECVKVMA